MGIPDPKTLADRVAEAKAIKETRDRVRREKSDRMRAEVEEARRVRAEKMAAGLLGRCPSCQKDVDAAEGIILRHAERPDYATTLCDGTGEQAQPIR